MLLSHWNTMIFYFYPFMIHFDAVSNLYKIFMSYQNQNTLYSVCFTWIILHQRFPWKCFSKPRPRLFSCIIQKDIHKLFRGWDPSVNTNTFHGEIPLGGPPQNANQPQWIKGFLDIKKQDQHKVNPVLKF